MAIFLNLLFPGLGHLYAGAGRRAIGYLLAAAAAQVLQAQGQSHRLLAVIAAGTLVWLVAFILSAISLEPAIDARKWAPHGRNTRPFAIVYAVVAALIVIVASAHYLSIHKADPAPARHQHQHLAV